MSIRDLMGEPLRQCRGAKSICGGRWLPASAFNKSQISCRDCCLEYNRQWRAENPDYFRQYNVENRERLCEHQRQYRAASPGKARAHNAIKRAVKTGRVVRHDRCEECGAIGLAEAHHYHGDYPPEHDLDVVWLCRSHHQQEHAAWERGESILTCLPEHDDDAA